MLGSGEFSDVEKRGVYRAIQERRDVRSGFLPEPLGEPVLLRLLEAAHHAPSVGFMQPWRFLLVRSLSVRKRVQEIFQEANRVAQKTYEGVQATQYSSLKLEGILEAPQNLCILCDMDNERGHRLGRHSMPETAVYSAVCAVPNLWLAGRAEGVGVGWVSIFDPNALKQVLGVPPSIMLVAYLCLGYVGSFEARPELERLGWEQRMPFEETLLIDRFDRRYFSHEATK